MRATRKLQKRRPGDAAAPAGRPVLTGPAHRLAVAAGGAIAAPAHGAAAPEVARARPGVLGGAFLRMGSAPAAKGPCALLVAALALAAGPLAARPCEGGLPALPAIRVQQSQGASRGQGDAIAADVQRLAQVLRLDDELPIIREEGLDYADSIAASLFPDRKDGIWPGIAASLYEPARLKSLIMPQFAARLQSGGAQRMAEILAFFESPLGRRVTTLELSARQALLDDEIDKANAERVRALREQGDPRIALLQRFIDVNDLIERNLRGTLESDFAFYVGLRDGGGYKTPPSDQQILDQVRATREETRKNVEDWLFQFLWLAYSPLSDEEMNLYIDFSRSEAGQLFNEALFAGFDTMFDRTSHALGKAAAGIINSKDL